MNNYCKQNGFTLVELAIVLMIIGLLIGGILRGQELMQNARLQNVIKQVHSFTAAYNTFLDSYSAKPGDIPTASARIPGCQANNTNACQNGDGNSVIGTLVTAWTGGQQAATTENTQFWKHLSLTHLISGVRPNAVDPVWGESHPAAPIPGGYTIITSEGVIGTASPWASITTGSILLRLHGNLTSSNIEHHPLASPKQAAYIDRKMDDGIPQTGDVQSRANGNVSDCEMTYNEAREDAVCVLSFLLNR